MSFVSVNGRHLSMQPEAMAEMGWHPGQRITEAQMWEGIAANARCLCRANEGHAFPIDTTKLVGLCGHSPSPRIQALARAIAAEPSPVDLPRHKRH